MNREKSFGLIVAAVLLGVLGGLIISRRGDDNIEAAVKERNYLVVFHKQEASKQTKTGNTLVKVLDDRPLDVEMVKDYIRDGNDMSVWILNIIRLD